MSRLGFADMWVRLIMQCVTSFFSTSLGDELCINCERPNK